VSDKSSIDCSHGWWVVLMLTLAPLALLQCTSPESPAGTAAPSTLRPSSGQAPLRTGASAGRQVVARVGDKEITGEEIQERIQGQMLRIETQIYTLKKQAIDALIAERLLEEEAHKRNLTKEQLLQQEVNARVAKVSDAEIEQYYAANRQRFSKPLEEIKHQLVQQLTNAKWQQRSAAFHQELRKAAQVKIFLQPPIVQVAIDGAPARGPTNALVTIVEFSDFQ